MTKNIEQIFRLLSDIPRPFYLKIDRDNYIAVKLYSPKDVSDTWFIDFGRVGWRLDMDEMIQELITIKNSQNDGE